MDRMHNSSGSRYRPASEFDEATLARKREYWRIKKREQRAKLSVLKKERLKEVNTTVCKSRPSAGQLPGTKNGHMAVALGVPGPTLLKSDGTYEAGLYHNPSHNFENISKQGETEGNAGPTVGQICASQEGQPISASQKDRWFQKIKLNNVLPQFPTASSDSRNSPSNAGRKAVGCSSIGAVSGNFSPTKLNGARPDSFSQVPAIKIKVQQTGLAHCEDQNEKPMLNGSSSTISPQHNLAPQTGIYLHDYPSGIRVPVQNPGPGNSHANMSDVPSFTQIDMLESTIKKEVVDLLPEIGSPTTPNSNNQTVFPKGEELNEKEVVDSVAAAVEPVAAQQASKATTCHQRLQDGAERWGPVRSRMQRQKFLESQRIISQRNVRRAFSPAVALNTKNAQRNSMEETDEDRMARKREYWRIKKREQRAKLSGEVKAKMKERDSLLRRVKRYQCILDEMRRARTAAPKSQQSVNIPPSDSETIGGFIKEDGTMTSNIPQASANYRLSEQETLTESHTFSKNLLPVSNYGSGNSVLRKPVEITAPPPLKCATQMKGTSYPNAMTSLNPPRLVSNRARPASNTIPKNLQNTHTTMPQTSNFLRRPHNLQNTYPVLTLLKHRQVVGKPPATPLAPGGLALKRVPTGSSCPTTVPKWHLVPELSEEERMAKKREYWRIKKREQRAKRSARARQTLFQSKYSSVIQRQQSQRILSARRTASLNSLRSISANRPPSSTLPSKPVIPTSIPDKQANIKQEEEPGPTEDVCGGLDPPDIKPCLSSPPEQPVEQDPSTGMDSQATTLLAVASMKKLLEESLSSVADSNVLPSCKREQVSSEEDVAQVEVKPSLPSLSQEAEGSEIPQEKHHSALGSTPQSAVLHAGEEQSRSCLKPSQVPSTSQAPSCQSLASSQAGSPSSNVKHSQTPLSSPSSTHAPICRQATSSDQPFQLRRAQRLREKRIGQHCCSPVPPIKAVNSPSQPDEDVLRKKREYWRIAKREQRAKKATQEREMRKLVVQGKQPIQRLSQGAPICTVKIHKPELRNVGHNSPPTLHTTNSPPLALSSATGTLTSLEAVTTLPIRKVFTPVKSIPLRCPNAFKNKSPAKDPPGKSSSLPVADSHASLICSTLPYPAGGDSRGTVQSGGAGSAGQLLLVGSQQNRASNPDAPQVKRWQMQVQGSADAPSSQSSLTKKLPPTSALQVGGTLAQGGAGMLTGRPQTYTPPSCNVLLRVGQEDARKPPDPSKPKTVEELDEDLRKKREYWRVKKKEQRARKAARERELKRQGTTGSSRAILPVKELPESLDTQGQVSDPWPSKASENPQLLPSTSSEYNDQAQLGLTAAGKDELDLGIEAVEEDEGGEEGHEDTPCSEASWRTRFLMDFDPLNQLLVCMVCGEMQHSHSVAGVRGHIEEAHPDTLALEARERQRILEAWDEQVFLRESFFSNQLQQHSATLSGESLEGPAEVEVMVDLEESPAVTNQSKASKAKSGKKA